MTVPIPRPDKEFSRAGKLEGWFNRKTLRSYGEACAQAERERLTAEIRTLRGFVVHYGGWKGEQALAGLDAPSPAGSETPAAGGAT